MRKQERNNIMTISFLAVTLLSCMVTVCLQMTVTAMPLLVVDMGLSRTLAGSTTTVCTLAALLFRPFSASLSKRMGERRAALYGGVLYLVLFLWYLFCDAIPIIFLIRGLQGIGMSLLTTALGSMATAMIPQEQMTKGMGYFGLGNAVAVSIGPAIGLWLVEFGGYPAVFLAGAVMSAVILLILLFLKEERKRLEATNKESQEHVPGGESRKSFGRLVIESGSLAPSLMSMLIIFSQTALTTYLSFLGESRGILKVGTFFTLNVFGMIFSRLFVGAVCERYGEKFLGAGATMLLIGAYLLVAFAEHSWMVDMAGILYGFGYGAFYSILNAAAVRNSTAENRGAANAVFFGAKDMGTAAGALLWGMLLEKSSYTEIYIACAGLSVVSFIYYLIQGRGGRIEAKIQKAK